MTEIQGTLFGEPAPEVRVLTVQQPWAWCLIHAEPRKDIENRGQEFTYRGRVLIHAGQKTDPEGVEFCREHGIELPPEAFESGHIVGSVELADAVTGSQSIWAQPGAVHHLMTSPRPATRRVTSHRGNLGLQNPPPDWERAFA